MNIQVGRARWRLRSTDPSRPLFALAAALAAGSLAVPALQAQAPRRTQRATPVIDPAIEVTVGEGTSMSVAVSPDGTTLAIDLQGSLWTLPASGGTAKRIGDLFDDARQPAFSPDGKTIAFFGYRDGGYDLWGIAPDGTGQRKLTWGPYDDREPAWSHDGTRLAFSSDRRSGAESGDYNVWILDLRSGALRQLTQDPANDFMPTWSPDDAQIAFVSTRGGEQAVWAVTLASGAERKVSSGRGRADAPSWGPGGEILHHVLEGQSSRLELDGRPLTGGENVFAFRPSWSAAGEFFYTSDGKIRKRSVSGGEAQTVEFNATLPVRQARYARRKRDFDSETPRPALGIVRPQVSPDGTRVVFSALGDIFLMPIGGKPRNLTRDRALDTEPAWSPDGSQVVYSSDKGGGLLQLWVRDLKTGQDRQLTRLDTQPMGATWSPDGRRIAFLEVDGMWRRASVSVVEVGSGAVVKIHESLFGPGTPTWSADGKRVALAMVAPYSTRFREGTNHVLTMPVEGGGERWFSPVPHLSIDSRAGCGPVWSPDGTKMAAVYEGVLAVFPVSPEGEPLGPPRRLTTEMAHSPSWTGDSKQVLYQSMDKLRLIDVETGRTRAVPLELKYTLANPKSRLVVHAGRLVDGRSETARRDVDVVIEGHRIRSVEPHAESRHADGTLVDASKLTVMPGLIEFHSHLQGDFGEAQGRAWLAFGITAVRSPGGTPYEAVEQREAVDAGVRAGPRVFSTGYLMEWNRVYYKMGVAVSSAGHLEMELQRARLLQHDLVKSYVRMPDLQQRRMVEFAHGIGIPVATHEVYPAALAGVDNTEHTAGTSRRGYSPKIATLQRSYADVAALFGKAGTTFCPMISSPGLRRLFEAEPALKSDPRFTLYPAWMRAQISAAPSPAQAVLGGSGAMVIDAQKAGARIVAGTDTPNGANLHGELMSYVMAGMTPYQALRTATVNPAEALGLDAGSVEPGKLADLVMVDRNPLEDIAHTHRVRRVVANGRLYELEDLLEASAGMKPAPATGAR